MPDYTPTVWQNGPAGGTPIDATSLNKIEGQLNSVSDIADTALATAAGAATTATAAAAAASNAASTAGAASTAASNAGTIALAAIPKTAYPAKGAVLAGTGDGTYTALTAGSNGQVLTLDSAQAAGVRWAAPGAVAVKRPVHLRVAAANAPQWVKDASDFVCDGTADEVQINQALIDSWVVTDPVGKGGGSRVELSGGSFSIATPVKLRHGLTLHGQGKGSILNSVGMAAGTGIVELFDIHTALTTLRDLTLWGNSGTGGGDSDAIRYVNNNGTTDGITSTYSPPNDPDCSHTIRDVFIRRFTSGTRNAIYLLEAKATHISGVRAYGVNGVGLWCDGTSDLKATECIFLSCLTAGVRNGGGNNVYVGVKAAYSDGHGFELASSRGQLSGCTAQDNGLYGIYLTGIDNKVDVVCDSNSNESTTGGGVFIGDARRFRMDATIYDRNQTTASRQTRGVVFGATSATGLFTGQISTPAGTNEHVGTVPAGVHGGYVNTAGAWVRFGTTF